ncbi:MAG: hypothetical protein IT267_04230 [Saprospiraceae bacterium]|nr:hypothetical protein [Saprospiraceae bacterium]
MLNKTPLSKYNHILLGIITGFIVPFVMYAIVLSVYDFLDSKDILNSSGLAPNFRERTIGLISIVSNLIPLHSFNRLSWHNSMRGVVFPTLLYVGLWMYLYGYELLSI